MSAPTRKRRNTSPEPEPPPHDVEAEQGVLGSMLFSRDAIARCAEQIESFHFHVPAHRTVFQALIDRYNAGAAIDLTMFTQYLRGENLLDVVGGAAYVTHLFNFVPTAVNLDYYLEIVRDKYIRRATIAACTDAVRRASELGPEQDGDALELLDDIELRIASIRSLGRNGATPGKSIIDLAEMDSVVFAKDSLIGKRFLCRGQGMLFIGPTGIGKSSAGLQMDLCFACGREAFGFAPAGAFKIMHVQSENDEGDLAEMAQGIIRALALTSRERELVRQNFIRYDLRGLTGEEFIRFLRAKVREHRPDLIHIDPLEAYAGGDLRDADIATRFLRVWIDKILVDYHVAIIINHHTTKTIYRDTSLWTPADWAYAGAGGAVIANWPRAIVAIEGTKARGVFKFHIGKRWTRSGWADEDAYSTNERVFCWHGSGSIYWRDATDDEVEALAQSKPGRPITTKEQLKAVVPGTDRILKHVLLEKRPEGMGYNRARAFLDELVGEKELFEHQIKRNGTRPEIWISRHEPRLL